MFLIKELIKENKTNLVTTKHTSKKTYQQTIARYQLMKILVVDDDTDIRNLVSLYLKSENYETLEASDGIDALNKISEEIDLVILDTMMPRMDGIETCIKIREKFNMPIIFLTSKTGDADKMIGFSSGADDYIIKPFNLVDLISRVKANIRRYHSYNTPPATKVNDEIFFLDLYINYSAKTVTKNNEILKLTKTEFSILELFLKNRGTVFTLEQIYSYVWNDASILNAESTVSVHVRNLRKKLGDDTKEPNYIKTVWGVGYRVD